MRIYIAVFATLILAACSGTVSKLGPGKETEAVRDFVVASELEEVTRIRITNQVKYQYVNDYFIVFPTRRGDYLIEFRGRCSELRSRVWTADMVDIRVSTRALYADYDTLRGCSIGTIYELPEAQLEELKQLGDAHHDLGLMVAISRLLLLCIRSSLWNRKLARTDCGSP